LSDGTLELAVLGSVDERIDAAVGEHQYHCEVIEPTDTKSCPSNELVYGAYSTAPRDLYCKKTDKVIEPAGEVDSVADEIEKE